MLNRYVIDSIMNVDGYERYVEFEAKNHVNVGD